jgi:fructose-bisphosphate aldolase class II
LSNRHLYSHEIEGVLGDRDRNGTTQDEARGRDWRRSARALRPLQEGRLRAAGGERHRLARRQRGARGGARGEGAVIIQLSHTGAQFYGGKTLDNAPAQASIAGSIAGALHVRDVAEAYGVPSCCTPTTARRSCCPGSTASSTAGEAYFAKNGEPLFSSHMLDLSEQPLDENLEISSKYLARIAKMKMTLEIELGVTGGEEDGVDNSGVEHSKLYTSPEDVLRAYDVLGPRGQLHGGGVVRQHARRLRARQRQAQAEILRDSQAFVKKERKTGDEPLSFVFHGGSGSTPRRSPRPSPTAS